MHDVEAGVDAEEVFDDAMDSIAKSVMTNTSSIFDESDSNENEDLGDIEEDEITPGFDEEEVIEEISQFNEENYELTELIDEGEFLSRQGDNLGALSAFNKAIAVDPSCDTAWFNRGVLLEGNGDVHGARQSFAITLDVNKDHAPAAANLAIILDRMGETKDAGKWAQIALKTFSGHTMLIEVVERAGLNIPIVQVAAASPVAPESPAALVATVAPAAAATPPEETASYPSDDPTPLPTSQPENVPPTPISSPADETIIAETIDVAALVAEATELLKQGKALEAFDVLKLELYSAAAKDHSAWNISAGALARMGHIDKAISSYQYALKLDDSNPKAWHNLAALLKRNEQISEAIDSYQKAFDLDVNYQKAAESLRTSLLSEGRINEALDVWEQMIENNHSNVDSQSFAQLLLKMAKGEADALELSIDLPHTLPEGPSLAKRALRHINSNDAMKATALSLSGDHVGAVSTWKQLLQIEPQNTDYWFGLAGSLSEAGDESTALQCRNKANGLLGNTVEETAVAETAQTPQPVAEPAQTPQPVAEPVTIDSALSGEAYNHELVSLENEFHDEPFPQEQISATSEVTDEDFVSASNSLLMPIQNTTEESVPVVQNSSPEVDLAKAALDAASRSAPTESYTASNSAIGNDIEWYNKGLGLIQAEKYREALSCLDRALPAFKNDDEMVIRILNARGNAFYYLEDYPKTIENYHQAMMINPKTVTGRTLYNMGTAYAEMERFEDAIKCYEQSIPRGLSKEEGKLAKEQIRRCNQINKEMIRKANRKQ